MSGKEKIVEEFEGMHLKHITAQYSSSSFFFFLTKI